MKAGSAGSNPDVAVNNLSATQPLRNFLNETGEAVAHLNTIIVGLDAVEKGHQKPEGINISWSPHDRKVAAIKARRFAIEAALQKSTAALKEYISAISKLEVLEAARRSWDKDTSSTDRIASVSSHLLGKEDYLHIGACLLVHWRNRIVHKRSKAELTPKQKRFFSHASSEIERNFGGLKVDRLFEDFSTNRPTLKDISSLITFTIRLVRKLDGSLGTATKTDLDHFLNWYCLDEAIERVARETSEQKRYASTIRLLETEAPALVKAYSQYYPRPRPREADD